MRKWPFLTLAITLIDTVNVFCQEIWVWKKSQKGMKFDQSHLVGP